MVLSLGPEFYNLFKKISIYIKYIFIGLIAQLARAHDC